MDHIFSYIMINIINVKYDVLMNTPLLESINNINLSCNKKYKVPMNSLSKGIKTSIQPIQCTLQIMSSWFTCSYITHHSISPRPDI